MAACPRCGAENAPGARFCSACGHSLAWQAAPYGPERKVVTIVFVDLVGFTSRAERLDPEDVGRVLTPYYGHVRTELERFGGTVEKFIGDAVVAVFGAPAAHEDDPERALRAAFAVRGAIAELNEAQPELDLAVRTGVTTGEVLVDVAADPSRGEVSVAGDVVNTAARLQQSAAPGAIVVDAQTKRATQPVADFRQLEQLTVKGKRDPVAAWEAVTLREHAGGQPPRPPRTPLVGREEELASLAGLATEARESGTLRAVSIVGEAGIGKSRLLWELHRSLEATGDRFVWLQGRSLPYGAGITFWAFADMVKAHAGILETDAAGVAAERLAASVAEAVPDEDEAAWVERYLRPLVGLAGEGGDRLESFAAWRRFLEGVAQGSGLLVLAFEDLQWADDGLLELVVHLAEWGAASPVLLLGTGRPELAERGLPPGDTVQLGPLRAEETVSLLGLLLAETPIRGDVWRRLLTRAGGNPLYAEEYARMLRDSPDADELPLPESVQSLIAARIDALPPDGKALLQDAAVIGKEFWVGALAAIAGVPRREADERLGELARRGLVRQRSASAVAGERQHAFSHILVRDTAYGQIPRARRSEKHRLAAEWIAGLAPDRSASLAEMTAHHYVSALEYARLAGQREDELGDRACDALRAAGDHAFELSAFATAERFYDDALRLRPEGADAPAVRLKLGTSRFRAEGTGREDLERAGRELLERGNPEAAAEAQVLLAELCFRRGDVEGSFERLEAAVRTWLDGRPPSREKAHVLSTLSRVRMAAGDAEEAIRIGREALAMAGELGLDEIRAHALNNIGASRVTLGDRGGVEDLERSVEISAALGSVEAVRAYLNLGTTLANLGDLERAFAVHADGRRVAERFGDAIGIRWFVVERLFEDYWRGRWDEGAGAAGSLLDETEATADYYTELGARIVRGWIRLGRGDLAGAREDAARHLELARDVRYPQALFPALAQAARVHAAAGAHDQAARYADELLEEWSASTVETASYWTADLAFALGELDGGRQLLDVAEKVTAPTAWLEAACAFAAGDTEGAADRFAAIGSRPDEAYARLRGPRAKAGETFVRTSAAAGYLPAVSLSGAPGRPGRRRGSS